MHSTCIYILSPLRTSFNPLEGIDERKITRTSYSCISVTPVYCAYVHVFSSPSTGSDTVQVV